MLFPTIFGYMALLFTYIACPISFPSSIYIYCVWVSPWTCLSSFSIEHIFSSSFSVLSFYSPCYLPPSFPIRSFPSRLHISSWACHIPFQYSLFYSTLPLISIQSHCSFLPFSNGGQWLFYFYQLPSNTPIQPSFKFFDKGPSLIATSPGNLFEFLYILVTGPPSLLDCSQLSYFSLFL